MTGILFCALLIATAIDPKPAPEVREYLMYTGDKEIGHLKVERLESGDETTYASENVTSVSFIKKFTLRHVIHSTFRQGKLWRAEVWVHLNENLREHSLTTREGDRYRVEREGEDPVYIDEPILDTSLSIYFQEPVGAGKVFSEQYGVFNPMRESGNHVYAMDRKGNRTNLYFYREGELVRARFETMLLTARLELQ